MKERLDLMIVVGEASGDSHAAALVRALRAKAPRTDIHFFGAAGAKMREAGVEPVIKADDLSIVGLPEIARALPMFWRTFSKLKEAAIERKPDAVILVDFPDFNLRLAKTLKKAGLNVIYYISPQLWAWRKHRVKIVEKYIDLMLAILPFEKNWYATHGVGHVEYVGNPLAGEVKATLSRDEFCRKHGLDTGREVVSLLPGSRHKEIVRILPELIRAAGYIAERKPDCQFLIALANERRLAEVNAIIAATGESGAVVPERLKVVCGETYDALNASDAAVVTSGTATLETAVIGTPSVIVYKTSSFNWHTLRPLIDVPFYGLVNLIAEEEAVRELIQDDMNREQLGAEVLRLLEPEENAKMRAKMAAIKEKLGSGGASVRAAEAILRFLSV